MDRRILFAVLFASLALNVFVLGAFVGARLSGGRLAPQPAAVAQEARARNPVLAAVRALPPDAQAAWRAQMPGFARDYGPRMREARRLTRQTMHSFGREPFDADAALADLQKARAIEYAGRQEMDRRIVTFAATLPPAERAQFGEALARPPMRGAAAN
jgi:uncharacterized membrane protein